jgi:SAM-dependent methyltransferase
VEVSRARIERARQRHPGIQFYDCPLEESDIAEESLDLAVMDNVIEHLPDPLEMLRQIRRHLSPNGRCVLMTPNMQSGNFRLLGRRWTPELAPHAHIFLFTEEALNESLRVAGFDVETSGTFHPQCAPSWEILRSTNLKEAVWRLMQAAGSLYARCIRQGPMLYAVATPSNQQSADHKAGGDRASGTET